METENGQVDIQYGMIFMLGGFHREAALFIIMPCILWLWLIQLALSINQMVCLRINSI